MNRLSQLQSEGVHSAALRRTRLTPKEGLRLVGQCSQDCGGGQEAAAPLSDSIAFQASWNDHPKICESPSSIDWQVIQV
jgi:hypothetical protein